VRLVKDGDEDDVEIALGGDLDGTYHMAGRWSFFRAAVSLGWHAESARYGKGVWLVVTHTLYPLYYTKLNRHE
jgi:hypothetical protein